MQDAYAAALERDTLPAYEDFLGAYPDDPMAKRVRAIAAARREAKHVDSGVPLAMGLLDETGQRL